MAQYVRTDARKASYEGRWISRRRKLSTVTIFYTVYLRLCLKFIRDFSRNLHKNSEKRKELQTALTGNSNYIYYNYYYCTISKRYCLKIFFFFVGRTACRPEIMGLRVSHVPTRHRRLRLEGARTPPPPPLGTTVMDVTERGHVSVSNRRRCSCYGSAAIFPLADR